MDHSIPVDSRIPRRFPSPSLLQPVTRSTSLASIVSRAYHARFAFRCTWISGTRLLSVSSYQSPFFAFPPFLFLILHRWDRFRDRPTWWSLEREFDGLTLKKKSLSRFTSSREADDGEGRGPLLGRRLAGHLFTVWKDDASIARALVLRGAMSEMSARSGTGACKLNIHPRPFPSSLASPFSAILQPPLLPLPLPPSSSAAGCPAATVYFCFSLSKFNVDDIRWRAPQISLRLYCTLNLSLFLSILGK